MDCFKNQTKDVPLHITFDHAVEMSTRSEVVGIFTAYNFVIAL